MTWIFFPLILSPLLQHLRQIFKAKKVFLLFCWMILFFFWDENFFLFPRNQQRKFIEPVAQLSSCHTFLFLSNQASFIYFPLPGSNSSSYLRYYLNGVDIKLKHSLTHCTFKARECFESFFVLFPPAHSISYRFSSPHCISCFKFTARLRSGRETGSSWKSVLRALKENKKWECRNDVSYLGEKKIENCILLLARCRNHKFVLSLPSLSDMHELCFFLSPRFDLKP